MKKLLFLGIDTTTADAFAYAKSKGVYTIISDYLDQNSSPLKAQADEFWQLDVKDLDTLEQRCRKADVTHIYAGSHETCVDSYKMLCERLGIPFYASEEGWKASRDKEIFKEYCVKVGLDVPRKYWIGGYPPEDVFNQIAFPGIVKPNDGCAKRGITIVSRTEDLLPAVESAFAHSDQKKIIIEEYVEGYQVTVFCYIENGNLHYIDAMIDLGCEVDGKNGFGLGIHHSQYDTEIENNLMPLYEKMIQEMNCRHGTIFFQSILRDHKFYNLEIGYRLDGIGSWKHIERQCGFNQLKLMVDLALQEADEDTLAKIDSNPPAEICAYSMIWGKPGQICSIGGKEELYSRRDVVVQCDRFRQGDTIPDTDDMTAIALIIEVFGTSMYEIGEKLKEINRMIHYYDEGGNDLLIYNEQLFEKWEAFLQQA